MASATDTDETTTELLARKIVEVRALAAELRGGADELDASADYWAAVNAGQKLPSGSTMCLEARNEAIEGLGFGSALRRVRNRIRFDADASG